MGRTFTLSFKRLDPASTTDALAARLLSRAAWFAPGEPISRSLLLKTVPVKPGDLAAESDAEDALRRLIDLGLVESNTQNDLLMHRHVATWARTVGESDEAREAVEETALAEAARLNEAGDPELLRVWQPHLQAVADRAAERASVLQGQEDYKGARLYFERALAIREKVLGPEHADTAKSLLNLGTLCFNQGNFAKARWYLSRALPILKAQLGPNHTDTIMARWRLGHLPGARQVTLKTSKKKPGKKKR